MSRIFARNPTTMTTSCYVGSKVRIYKSTYLRLIINGIDAVSKISEKKLAPFILHDAALSHDVEYVTSAVELCFDH